MWETCIAASQNNKVEKQNFASKSFHCDSSGESSSESVEIVHETKKRNRNEFAAYFGRDGSSSDISHSMDGKEIFSLHESGNSHGCPVDAVRPVAQVLFNKSENDDVELLLPDDDEGSRDGYGRNGMQYELFCFIGCNILNLNEYIFLKNVHFVQIQIFITLMNHCKGCGTIT